MQHCIVRRDHCLGADLSGGGAKEGQQLGGAPTFVLMGLDGWVAFRLPRGPWLRDRLIRPGLIFIELDDPGRFCLLAGELNQSFFSGVRSS